MKRMILATGIALTSSTTIAQIPVYGSFKVEHAKQPTYSNSSTLLDKYNTTPQTNTPTYTPPAYNPPQTYTPKQDFEIQYADIRYMVGEINTRFKNGETLYIETRSNGERRIRLVDTNFDGLFNDEYYGGLEITKTIFQLIFSWVNYNREYAVSMFTLTQALKKKQIMGMEFKTKSHTHFYSWEDIIR